MRRIVEVEATVEVAVAVAVMGVEDITTSTILQATVTMTGVMGMKTVTGVVAAVGTVLELMTHLAKVTALTVLLPTLVEAGPEEEA